MAVSRKNSSSQSRRNGRGDFPLLLVLLFVCMSVLFILGLVFTWWKRSGHKVDDDEDSNGVTTAAAARTRSSSSSSKGYVCLSSDKLEQLLMQKANSSTAIPPPPAHPPPPPLYVRDKRVLHDQLYPPLNREERDALMFAPPPPIDTTGHKEDTFRLLGYITYTDDDAHSKKDAGNNTWKCMGRMKNRHEGEFYAVPANTNDDLKIPLEPGTLASGRLRDLDTIPSELQFNSPFFNRGTYTFVELPKRDLGSVYY